VEKKSVPVRDACASLEVDWCGEWKHTGSNDRSGVGSS